MTNTTTSKKKSCCHICGSTEHYCCFKKLDTAAPVREISKSTTSQAHTPAPWFVAVTQKDEHENILVATIGKEKVMTDSEQGDEVADARLIAAAPDGLGAGKIALSALQGCAIKIVSHDEILFAIDALKAFISKAEGK